MPAQRLSAPPAGLRSLHMGGATRPLQMKAAWGQLDPAAVLSVKSGVNQQGGRSNGRWLSYLSHGHEVSEVWSPTPLLPQVTDSQSTLKIPNLTERFRWAAVRCLSAWGLILSEAQIAGLIITPDILMAWWGFSNVSAHLFQPVKCQLLWPLGPWVGGCFDSINEINSRWSCSTFFVFLLFSLLAIIMPENTLKPPTKEAIISPISRYIPTEFLPCLAIIPPFEAFNLQHLQR